MAAAQDGDARVVLTDVDLKLNFKATFSEVVTKFAIDVDDEFLRTTKLKASLTRLVSDMEHQPEHSRLSLSTFAPQHSSTCSFIRHA